VAAIVLLGCMALGLFPFLLSPTPFKEPFFYVWYGGLGALGLWFVVLFVRNPKFTMLVHDGHLTWHDGVNPKMSGSVECEKILYMRVETHEGSESFWVRVSLVLLDGKNIELPNNCLPSTTERLLNELRSCNPRITKQVGTY
jgi:hypothetical protein